MTAARPQAMDAFSASFLHDCLLGNLDGGVDGVLHHNLRGLFGLFLGGCSSLSCSPSHTALLSRSLPQTRLVLVLVLTMMVPVYRGRSAPELHPETHRGHPMVTRNIE